MEYRINATLMFFLLFSSTFAQNSRIWGSYYGEGGTEEGHTVVTDASGNVYLVGRTNSIQGIASGGFQTVYAGGNNDAFLVKFNAAGARVWSTYFGGPGEEDETSILGGISVAVDAFGNIYLAGQTNSTSGIASGGFQNAYGGGAYDAFLVKYNASGNRLWATYYGGSGEDQGFHVSTDASGNVYLVGWTDSPSGIASGGFQNSYGGGGDAFLVKFSTTGARIWATYFGGSAQERGMGLNLDAMGNIYVTGQTASSSGVAFNGFQNTYGGGVYDSFLAKFDASGSRLWATYYGGSGTDYTRSIALDALGGIYIAGISSSPGIASGGYQNTNAGGLYDGLLVKFSSSGSRIWSTYYGDLGTDWVYYTASDPSGNIHISGRTDSYSGISSGGFQNSHGGGGSDAFLVTFSSTGTRLCASYYGGTDFDFGFGICADGTGDVYQTGYTNATVGIASGGFQNTYGGGNADAFLVKFSSCAFASASEITSPNVCMIYPNPSSGQFELSSVNPNEEIVVYNSIGEEVKRYIACDLGYLTIDLSVKPAGLYICRVIRNSNEIYTGRLIKY